MLGEDSPGYIVLLEQLSQLFRVTHAFACDKREGRSCLRVETSDQAVHSCHNLNLREDVDVLKVVDLVVSCHLYQKCFQFIVPRRTDGLASQTR